jgi:probable rRNA maturation factor
MLDFDNQTTFEIDAVIFEDIKEVVAPNKMLELIIVDDGTIQELNREHRKLDKPTDVLSFPIKESKTNFIGSVIISADTAKRVAQELGHSMEDELKILFIHGLLHVMGFDHETDNGQMKAEEELVGTKAGIAKNLLSR